MSRTRTGGGLLLLAATACVAVSCSRVGAKEGAKPARSDEIIFSHALHAKANVNCLACHETVYDAENLEGQHLPPEAKCLECHGEWKQRGDCGKCHRDGQHPGTYARLEPHLRMSHAKHIELTNEECGVCHKALPEPGAEGPFVPSKPTCMSCHNHKVEIVEKGICNTCHINLKKFPLEPITLLSHQGDFTRKHGRVAASSSESCATCHDQTYCAECHARTAPMRIELRFPEQVNADFIHRADYVSRHAIEARADQSYCRRCHGTGFCESCHTANNLTPFSANPRSPHPAGFSFPGSPNSHASAARRDIASCAGCHDQGARSICVDCHRVGGVGGNPHPNGWTAKHPASEIGSNGMCLICHQQ